MKAFKKILSSLLVVVMCLTSAPLEGFVSLDWSKINFGVCFGSSVSALSYGDFEYEVLDDNTIAITDYTGNNRNVTLPTSIKGKSVSTIARMVFYYNDSVQTVNIGSNISSVDSEAFYYCPNLQKINVDSANMYYSSDENGVLFNKDKTELIQYPIGSSLKSYTIPDSVIKIYPDAFYSCNKLESIVIPNGMTEIGKDAFHNCESLKEIFLPNTIKKICEFAFGSCSNLVEVNIPDGVNTIGEYAFWLCERLTNIKIPSTVEYIGVGAFDSCYSLTEFLVEEGNATYSSDDYGVLFNSDKTQLIKYPMGNERKAYEVPVGVLSIGEEAFGDSVNLESVIIASSVKKISIRAFTSCDNLVNIDIPEGVVLIDDYAFSNCNNLTCVTVSSSVERIGEYVFLGCYSMDKYVVDPYNKCYSNDETGVLFNEDKTVIVDYPKGKQETSYDIPKSVISIGDMAFGDCINLTDIEIPDSVTSIGYCAFENCVGLINITIPDSVTTLRTGAFVGCINLSSVDLGNGIKNIEELTFSFCTKLNDITIPDSVISIGNAAFEFCESLTNITLPESVSMLNSAFSYCSNLESITILNPECSIDDSDYAISPSATIYCYSNSTAHKHAEKYGLEFVIISCSHDDIIEYENESPKCTDKGFTAGTYCNTCKTWLVSRVEIPVLGHDYSEEWTIDQEATCTENGSKSHHCNRCDDRTDVTVINSNGHNYGEWKTEKETTVLAEGLKVRVCDKCGDREEEIIDKIHINIEENSEYGLANFTVVNAQTLEPIEGASIYIATKNDGENTFFTDEEGKASIILPIGKQTISVYLGDYKLRTLNITINPGENNIADIGLSEYNAIDADITVTEMTYEEILDAGIDVSAPENNQIFKYEVVLTYDPAIDVESLLFYFNSEGECVGGEGTGTAGFGTFPAYKAGDGYAVKLPDETVVYAASEKMLLVIRGEARWLKEIFDVEMVIMNNSMTDTIEDCEATLDLPDGLLLAKMSEGEQNITQTIEYIGVGSSETVHWYVCGDKEGDYTIGATLEGKTMPFEEEFSYHFETDSSIHVYAGSALALTLEVPDVTYYNEDALIKVTLENVSDRTLYNVTHSIENLKQCRVTYEHDGTVDTETYQNVSDIGSIFVKEMQPGDKIVIEISVNILFDSEAMKAMLENWCSYIDGIEKLFNKLDVIDDLTDAVYGVIEGALGVITSATKGLKALKEATTTNQAKKAALEELMSVITKFEKVFVSSNSKSITAANKFVNSEVYKIFEDISNNSDTSIYLKTEFQIAQITGYLLSFIKQYGSESSNASKDSDSKAFNVFDSIRTAIRALPIYYIFSKDESYATTLAGSTTEIPVTIKTYDNGHVQYFGISDMGKYIYSLAVAAVGKIKIPAISNLLLGYDVSEISGYSKAVQYIKATEAEIARVQAISATGDISFKAYVVKNEEPVAFSTRTITTVNSENIDDYFVLSSDNETAQYKDGILTFTGGGIIEVTPLTMTDGTLYIEDSEGNIFTYEIEVVPEHDCNCDEEVVITTPTANYNGYTAKCCSVCEDVIDIVKTNSCREHAFADWKIDFNTTCEECGIRTQTCTLCGYIETDFIEAKGHKEKIINKADATCTELGYTGDVVCETCGESISIGETVAVKDHDYESVVIEPTCTEDGYTTYTCSACGDNYTADYKDALKHTGGVANCKDKAVCTRCNTAYGEIDVTNHKDIVTDKAVAASCSSTGLTEGSHCDACGTVVVKQTTTNKLPHTEKVLSAVNATCTTTGLTEGKKCSVCGDIIVKQTETPKLKHSYKSVVTAPTCTTKGYTTYTCSVCGDNYKGDEKAALGHNMGAYTVTKQPTCTDKGTETSKCSRCNHTATRTIDAKGHNYKDGVCAGCGKNKVENCSHLCHESGFMGFIWKIVQFFWKLFKMNPVCECGVKHY